MIRPFLELQNQNMVNLQMMIVAQNKYNNHQYNRNNGAVVLPAMGGMPNYGMYPQAMEKPVEDSSDEES